jgi:hypothetical protein
MADIIAQDFNLGRKKKYFNLGKRKILILGR